jgi:hypothetical protein
MAHVGRIGEIRNACKVLVGKPEWKRPVADERLILKWILGK